MAALQDEKDEATATGIGQYNKYNFLDEEYDPKVLDSVSSLGKRIQSTVAEAMERAESLRDDVSINAATALFDLAKIRKELKADNVQVLERLAGLEAQLAILRKDQEAQLAILRKDQEAQGSQMAEDRQNLRAELEIVQSRLLEYSCVSHDVEEYIVYGRKQIYLHMLRRKLIDGIRLTFSWGAYYFLNEFIRFFIEPGVRGDIRNWTLFKLGLSTEIANKPKEGEPKPPAPLRSPSNSYAHVARASVSSVSAISGVPSGSASSKHSFGSAIAKNEPIAFSPSSKPPVALEGSIKAGIELENPQQQHDAGYFRPFDQSGRMGGAGWKEFWDNKLAAHGDVRVSREGAHPTFKSDQFLFWWRTMSLFVYLLKEDLDRHTTRSQAPTLTSASASAVSVALSTPILAKLPFHRKKGKEKREKEEKEKREKEEKEKMEEEKRKEKEQREANLKELGAVWSDFARDVYNKHAKGFTREEKNRVLDCVSFARTLLFNSTYFAAVCIDVDKLRKLGNEAVHDIAFPLKVDKGNDHDWRTAIDQVKNMPTIDNPETTQKALNFAYTLMKHPRDALK